MRWTCDTSGRFRQRPYYTDSELEQICEDAICGFLRERHGKAVFPVSTADLTVLIEQHVDDLDSYSDLEDGIDGFLFAMEEELKKLFDGEQKETRNTCHRDHIHGGATDWMEWQAGFACGALLMPQTELSRAVKAFRDAEQMPYADIGVKTESGKRLISKVMDVFQVSEDAARVRLEQRKAIVRNPVAGLFG